MRLADLRGKVVVLSPMYATCDETCPVSAQQIRGALDDLSGAERERIRAFALSVDPANDTPDRAQEFLLNRRLRGYLDFLLGTRRELQPVWREYGFAPQTEEREHNSYVVLLDGKGRQRVGFPVSFLTPEALAHDLRLLRARGCPQLAARVHHVRVCLLLALHAADPRSHIGLHLDQAALGGHRDHDVGFQLADQLVVEIGVREDRPPEGLRHQRHHRGPRTSRRRRGR